MAREALAEGIVSPLVLNLRAYGHELEGRDAEALADLEWAYKLSPGDVPVLNALGLAYARLGRTQDAVRAFEAACRHDPEFAPAQLNRGWASEDLGELAAARSCYERATKLSPSSADAWARLAALNVRLGDWDEGRANAQRALALHPRLPLAIVALARTELMQGDFGPAQRRVQAVLAESNTSPADRARAEGCLGDLLDSQESFASAFAAYARRNEALRGMYQARFSGTGAQSMPQYLDWLSRAFTKTAPAAWRSPATAAADDDGPRRHTFVLGFARSGTTLLEEVLARSPLVATTQERDGQTDAVREFLTDPEGISRLAAITRSERSHWRNLYWRRIEEFGIEYRNKVLVDKQPFNTARLPLIASLFGGAKILFCVRDPRDVVLSCFRREFRINPSTFEFLTLEGTARLYDSMMRIGEQFIAGLPLDIMRVRHEDLIKDFDGRLRSVCNFIDLPWCDAMRNIAAPQQRRMVATPSSTQIKRGLNDAGVGQWRKYRPQLEPVLPILAPWIKRFGYSPE